MTMLNELETKSNETVVQAGELTILNQEEYRAAADFLKTNKALQKEIKEHHKPIIEKAHETHKIALAQQKKYLVPLVSAESIVKGKMITWTTEIEKARRKEEARLAEKARKEAEKLAERARKAEASGKVEKAEVLREEAAEAAIMQPVVKGPEKVEGVSIKKTYKIEVTNFAELAAACTRGKTQMNFIQVNQKELDAFARLTKGSVEVPGCRVYVDKNMAVR